ncbi:MAG: hypothetical protein ABI888_01645 [Chloroflexota bacterium]
MSRGRGPAIAWAAYGAVAGLMALVALLSWGRALRAAGPTLYGEGAVAHAALLIRTLDTYRDAAGGSSFTAANYPPLFFAGAAAGDPFVTGRLLSIAATLSVAGLIAWRARAGGRLVAAVIALGWLALAPVAIWGPAVKPDLLALALTAGSVIALERRNAQLSAALIILAVLAKPTAVIVAIALLAWLVVRDRQRLRVWLTTALSGVVLAAIVLLPIGYDNLWRHVIVWNALPWTLDQAALLVFLGVVILAALVGTVIVARPVRGPIAAYCVAGAVIVVLGGREGATINYLLDLSVAASLALAAVAPAISRVAPYPVIALLNLLLAIAVLDPLGVVPGRSATTGAWGDPARIASAERALAGDEIVLAEDSGLLIATGHRVVVDDLFLWSRLVTQGTIDPLPLLVDVRAARFTAIVTEVELGKLADAAAYARSRWAPPLVQAIEARYRLESRLPGGLFVYRPR